MRKTNLGKAFVPLATSHIRCGIFSYNSGLCCFGCILLLILSCIRIGGIIGTKISIIKQTTARSEITLVRNDGEKPGRPLRFPYGHKKRRHTCTLNRGIFVFVFESCPHPCGMRPRSEGISPGLKKCPPDTFLPSCWSGRPLRFPYGHKKRRHTNVCLLFLVTRTGIEPMLPP